MENTAGKTGEEQKREEGEHYQSFSLFQSPPGLLKILVCCYGSASSFPSPLAVFSYLLFFAPSKISDRLEHATVSCVFFLLFISFYQFHFLNKLILPNP